MPKVSKVLWKILFQNVADKILEKSESFKIISLFYEKLFKNVQVSRPFGTPSQIRVKIFHSTRGTQYICTLEIFSQCWQQEHKLVFQFKYFYKVRKYAS